jgi:uncharacterized MAPEG superfamily protein
MASSATPYVWSLILSFAALLISIILLYAARFSARLEVKDLAALRSMFDRFPAWGKRASWEAFAMHAPAALLAVVAVLNGHTLPGIAVTVALAHPLLRVAYISAYLLNVPIARSVAWFLGLLCSGILYGVGLEALM